MATRLWAACLMALCANLAALTPARAAVEWIDVHFHVVGDKGKFAGFAQAADRTIEVMDDSHMSKILVMSPPRPFQSYDVEELLRIHEKYPGRIAVMGGGGTLNPMIQAATDTSNISPELKKKFEARAEAILAMGAKGFGEMTAHHVSLNPHHGYESTPADHPLFLLLADIAARHDVPIDLHFDPIPRDMDTPAELGSPKNPPVLKENISGFERLLEHNPKTKIVWAHAGSDPVGFFTPQLVRRLLEKHPNLYCSIRTVFRTHHPMWHPKRGINRKWVQLVEDFPDRFVFGTDSFIITNDYTGPNGPRVFERKTWIQRKGVNEVLSYMDDDLARKVAHDNAVRIYHLKD